MAERYYLDTSIWLDFFENRNEPNMPKGDWAHALLNKFVEDDDKVVYSDIVLLEIGSVGYTPEEIEKMFRKIKPALVLWNQQKNNSGKPKTSH